VIWGERRNLLHSSYVERSNILKKGYCLYSVRFLLISSDSSYWPSARLNIVSRMQATRPCKKPLKPSC